MGYLFAARQLGDTNIDKCLLAVYNIDRYNTVGRIMLRGKPQPALNGVKLRKLPASDPASELVSVIIRGEGPRP